MNRHPKSTQEPLVVYNQRIPSWAVPPMLFSLWTLWVFALGPSPTPPWMHTSAILASVAPLAILIFGVGLMFWRGKQDREGLLQHLGFTPLDKKAMKEIQQTFTLSISIKTIPRTSRLQYAFTGEWNNSEYEFLIFSDYSNESGTDYTIVTLKAAPAPGDVSIIRAMPKPIRFFYLNRLRVGSKLFQRNWLTHGDQETAEFLITENFESEISTNLKIQGARCFWLDNRFGFGFTGIPTRAGLEYCLEKTNVLASIADIKELESSTQLNA
jgi:hypothetical protein